MSEQTSPGPVIHSKRRLLAAASALAATGGLSACASPVRTASGSAKKPVFLLVHGAWHGGWCWDRVATRLRADGFRTFTPTQTGMGERAHLISRNISMDMFVQDLQGVMESEELDDVIVVGHSFGGRSAAGLVDRMPAKVRHLVFLDSSLPEGNKSFLDLLPPESRAARLKAAEDSSGGVSIAVPDAGFFGLDNAADRAWVQRRLTPHPLSTYTTPLVLKNTIGNGRPVSFIRCTKPNFAFVDPSAAFARAQPGWGYFEIPTGHDAMVSAPDELTGLLKKFA
ncbi:MAG: alpha/beta hydrolase [Comamonadaceae bacterium]|nr:MAG: alpha/beta hydrolase [Comamonadaceae bacterium]